MQRVQLNLVTMDLQCVWWFTWTNKIQQGVKTVKKRRGWDHFVLKYENKTVKHYLKTKGEDGDSKVFISHQRSGNRRHMVRHQSLHSWCPAGPASLCDALVPTHRTHSSVFARVSVYRSDFFPFQQISFSLFKPLPTRFPWHTAQTPMWVKGCRHTQSRSTARQKLPSSLISVCPLIISESCALTFDILLHKI